MQKTNIKPYMAILILAGIMSLMTAPSFSAGEVATMGKDELKSLLGSNTLIILDVRTGPYLQFLRFKQGAQRADYRDFDKWSSDHPKDKILVLYCA